MQSQSQSHARARTVRRFPPQYTVSSPEHSQYSRSTYSHSVLPIDAPRPKACVAPSLPRVCQRMKGRKACHGKEIRLTSGLESQCYRSTLVPSGASAYRSTLMLIPLSRPPALAIYSCRVRPATVRRMAWHGMAWHGTMPRAVHSTDCG